MKDVFVQTREVESVGFGESASMTIKATGRSFRNLVDSIYSKKEETVVRELIANALDSHAKAGIPDTPIKVFLPSLFEPNFAVRDFGVGMDHRFIMDHYSELFNSTKQSTNEETGMFGIGSKSPLALVDAFTLRAFDGKQVRIYEICVPKDGVPRIDHSMTLPSEEPRGVEVVVPLDTSHRIAIIQGLANQHFSWFDKPLEFEGVGYPEIALQRYGGITKLTDRIYIGDTDHKSIWNVEVRQGAAVYPLDYIGHTLDQRVKEVIQSLSEQCKVILIDLPIGTCSVTMSREAIQYDEVSRQNIADVLNAEFTRLETEIASNVRTARTYPEAVACLADSYLGDVDKIEPIYMRMLLALADLASDRIIANWKAWVAENEETLTEYVPQPRSTFDLGKRTLGFQANFHDGKIWGHSTPIVNLNTMRRSSISVSPADIVYVIPSHLKWTDTVREHLMEEAKGWKLPPGQDSGLQIWVIRCARKYVPEIVEKLKKGGVFRSAFFEDDLPEQAKKVKVSNPAFSKTAVYPWLHNEWGGKIEPAYTSEAYYVVRHTKTTEIMIPQGSGLKPSGHIRQASFKVVLNNAVALGYVDSAVPVYRLTQSQAAKMKSNPLWKDLMSTIHKRASKDAARDRVRINIRNSRLSALNNSKVTNFAKEVRSDSKFAPTVIQAMEDDPLFAYGFGVTASQFWFTSDDKHKHTYLSAILSIMYETTQAFDSDRVEDYNGIADAFASRYRILLEVSHREDLCVSEQMLAYLRGTTDWYKNRPLPFLPEDFPELTALVKRAISNLNELSLTEDEADAA